MIVTDAPGKPRVKTPNSLKCTYCGCVHRLSDLKSTANCPNCAGNRMVAAETNEPFDLQAHLDTRKAYMQTVAQALGPSLRRRRDYCGTESSGPR